MTLTAWLWAQQKGTKGEAKSSCTAMMSGARGRAPVVLCAASCSSSLRSRCRKHSSRPELCKLSWPRRVATPKGKMFLTRPRLGALRGIKLELSGMLKDSTVRSIMPGIKGSSSPQFASLHCEWGTARSSASSFLGPKDVEKPCETSLKASKSHQKDLPRPLNVASEPQAALPEDLLHAEALEPS